LRAEEELVFQKHKLSDRLALTPPPSGWLVTLVT